jgi:hypothetical protein
MTASRVTDDEPSRTLPPLGSLPQAKKSNPSRANSLVILVSSPGEFYTQPICSFLVSFVSIPSREGDVKDRVERTGLSGKTVVGHRRMHYCLGLRLPILLGPTRSIAIIWVVPAGARQIITSLGDIDPSTRKARPEMICVRECSQGIFTPLLRPLTLLALVVMGGCGIDQPAPSELEGTSQALQLPSQYLSIFVSDSRTLSNVTVTFDGYNGLPWMGAPRYSDWEAVGGNLTGTSYNQKYESDMSIFDRTDNSLQEWYYGTAQGSSPNYSRIFVSPALWSNEPLFYQVRITVRAYINGACHEDYEDLGVWNGSPVLYFNGNGASWDGSCYRGNMLRTTP